MTVDQVMMLLTDRKLLACRRQTVDAVGLVDVSGRVKVRAENGTLIECRVGGKSKARMMMEEAKKRRKSGGD